MTDRSTERKASTRSKQATRSKQSTSVVDFATQNKTSHALKIKLDDLKVFKPLTLNQELFFEAYKAGDYFIALHGVAGTGKTFTAMYKSIEECLDKSNPFKKIIVVRSSVQARDMGHLPGDVDEKMSQFKQPYVQICETLFGRKDAWYRLEEQGYVEFISTAFIRGCSFDNAIVIVDEMQNMTWEELSTVMTRVGYMSKIIFCGDYRQCDINKKKTDMSGIAKFLDIANLMNCFTRIEFTVDDIIRSSLVKDFIIATIKYEDSH